MRRLGPPPWLAPFAVAAVLQACGDSGPAGPTGWLVKPFDPEQLLATVRKVLS